jgi:hydrogenase maturation factor
MWVLGDTGWFAVYLLAHDLAAAGLRPGTGVIEFFNPARRKTDYLI